MQSVTSGAAVQYLMSKCEQPHGTLGSVHHELQSCSLSRTALATAGCTHIEHHLHGMTYATQVLLIAILQARYTLHGMSVCNEALLTCRLA